MPTKDDHLRLASHNEKAIEHLLLAGDAFPDWVATCAFYAAVHLVEAVLSYTMNDHGRNHKRRLMLLKGNKRYDNIYRHFIALREASEIARYLETGFGKTYKTFVDYFNMEEVRTNLLNHRFHKLKQSAMKLLAGPR